MFASSVIVGDLDVDRPVRALGQIRHWSLMRMLYWPLRSPRRGSSALPGRAARCAFGAWPATALDLLKIEPALPYKLAQSSSRLFA
jgi:hypothetical protein